MITSLIITQNYSEAFIYLLMEMHYDFPSILYIFIWFGFFSAIFMFRFIFFSLA